jgi:hypothetical protein
VTHDSRSPIHHFPVYTREQPKLQPVTDFEVALGARLSTWLDEPQLARLTKVSLPLGGLHGHNRAAESIFEGSLAVLDLGDRLTQQRPTASQDTPQLVGYFNGSKGNRQPLAHKGGRRQITRNFGLDWTHRGSTTTGGPDGHTRLAICARTGTEPVAAPRSASRAGIQVR